LVQGFPEGAVEFRAATDRTGLDPVGQPLPRSLQAVAAGSDQLCLVRRRHALRQGRHCDVLLVDAIFLPRQEFRLHDRQEVGRDGQVRRRRHAQGRRRRPDHQPRRMESRRSFELGQAGRGCGRT
jgi:hypothetical protein